VEFGGEKKRCEKKQRCDILKAFAMMGALAWQATVIKMLILCLGWEIARGSFILSPRVLPPFCVPVPCFLLLAARLSDTPLRMLQIGKELQRNTQGTIVIRNLQSEVAIYRLDEFIDVDNFGPSNALILTHAMPVHAFVCVKLHRTMGHAWEGVLRFQLACNITFSFAYIKASSFLRMAQSEW